MGLGASSLSGGFASVIDNLAFHDGLLQAQRPGIRCPFENDQVRISARFYGTNPTEKAHEAGWVGGGHGNCLSKGNACKANYVLDAPKEIDGGPGQNAAAGAIGSLSQIVRVHDNIDCTQPIVAWRHPGR